MKTTTTKPAIYQDTWTDKQVNEFIGDYLMPVVLICVILLGIKLAK